MTTESTPDALAGQTTPPAAVDAPVTGTDAAPLASATVSETVIPALIDVPAPVGPDVTVVSAVPGSTAVVDAPQSETGTIVEAASNPPGHGPTSDDRVTLLPVTTTSYQGLTEGQTVDSAGGRTTAVLHVVHNNNPGKIQGQVQVADQAAGPWRQVANFELNVEGDAVELEVPAGLSRVVYSATGSVTLSVG